MPTDFPGIEAWRVSPEGSVVLDQDVPVYFKVRPESAQVFRYGLKERGETVVLGGAQTFTTQDRPPRTEEFMELLGDDADPENPSFLPKISVQHLLGED